MNNDLEDRLEDALHEAEHRAWDNLARYKFNNFGYWSSNWVRLNRIGGFKRPNPFRAVVQLARARIDNRRPATEPRDQPTLDPEVHHDR